MPRNAQIEFDLPDGCKARDVDVKIRADNVRPAPRASQIALSQGTPT